MRPELIITQSQCDVCAVSVEAVEVVIARQPALSQTQLLTLNPRSLAEVLLDVERIGDAAGAGNAGREYSASLRDRVAAVQAAASCGGPSPATGGGDRVARPADGRRELDAGNR